MSESVTKSPARQHAESAKAAQEDACSFRYLYPVRYAMSTFWSGSRPENITYEGIAPGLKKSQPIFMDNVENRSGRSGAGGSGGSGGSGGNGGGSGGNAYRLSKHTMTLRTIYSGYIFVCWKGSPSVSPEDIHVYEAVNGRFKWLTDPERLNPSLDYIRIPGSVKIRVYMKYVRLPKIHDDFMKKADVNGKELDSRISDLRKAFAGKPNGLMSGIILPPPGKGPFEYRGTDCFSLDDTDCIAEYSPSSGYLSSLRHAPELSEKFYSAPADGKETVFKEMPKENCDTGWWYCSVDGFKSRKGRKISPPCVDAHFVCLSDPAGMAMDLAGVHSESLGDIDLYNQWYSLPKVSGFMARSYYNSLPNYKKYTDDSSPQDPEYRESGKKHYRLSEGMYVPTASNIGAQPSYVSREWHYRLDKTDSHNKRFLAENLSEEDKAQLDKITFDDIDKIKPALAGYDAFLKADAEVLDRMHTYLCNVMLDWSEILKHERDEKESFQYLLLKVFESADQKDGLRLDFKSPDLAAQNVELADPLTESRVSLLALAFNSMAAVNHEYEVLDKMFGEKYDSKFAKFFTEIISKGNLPGDGFSDIQFQLDGFIGNMAPEGQGLNAQGVLNAFYKRLSGADANNTKLTLQQALLRACVWFGDDPIRVIEESSHDLLRIGVDGADKGRKGFSSPMDYFLEKEWKRLDDLDLELRRIQADIKGLEEGIEGCRYTNDLIAAELKKLESEASGLKGANRKMERDAGKIGHQMDKINELVNGPEYLSRKRAYKSLRNKYNAELQKICARLDRMVPGSAQMHTASGVLFASGRQLEELSAAIGSNNDKLNVLRGKILAELEDRRIIDENLANKQASRQELEGLGDERSAERARASVKANRLQRILCGVETSFNVLNLFLYTKDVLEGASKDDDMLIARGAWGVLSSTVGVMCAFRLHMAKSSSRVASAMSKALGSAALKRIMPFIDVPITIFDAKRLFDLNDDDAASMTVVAGCGALILSLIGVSGLITGGVSIAVFVAVCAVYGLVTGMAISSLLDGPFRTLGRNHCWVNAFSIANPLFPHFENQPVAELKVLKSGSAPTQPEQYWRELRKRMQKELNSIFDPTIAITWPNQGAAVLVDIAYKPLFSGTQPIVSVEHYVDIDTYQFMDDGISFNNKTYIDVPSSYLIDTFKVTDGENGEKHLQIKLDAEKLFDLHNARPGKDDAGWTRFWHKVIGKQYRSEFNVRVRVCHALAKDLFVTKEQGSFFTIRF